jgi:cell division protein FtsB
MDYSIKSLALYLCIGLLVVSGLSIYYLFDVVEEQAVKNGQLESQLSDTSNKNVSLTKSIDRLTEEAKHAQLAADKFAVEKLQSSQQVERVVTVIKEVIKNEACNDVLIPNADKWMYYNEDSN